MVISQSCDHLDFGDTNSVRGKKSTSQIAEDDVDIKTKWGSIFVIAIVAFISMIPASVVGPIEWAYLQISDHQADEAFYGYLVSGNALGQILSSAIFGFVSNRLQQVKAPILAGYVLAIISCGIYISIEFVSHNKRFIFIGFEFILGLAVGAIQMYKIHVAMASSSKDRSKAFAMVSLAGMLAMISGPVMQYCFSMYLKYPGLRLLYGLHLNVFTAPGYLIIIFSFIGIGIMSLYFSSGETMKDSEAAKVKKQITKIQMKDLDDISIGQGVTLYDTLKKKKKVVKLDYLAILVCFIIKFAISITIILLRTIMIPYIQAVFAFNAKELVTYTSIIQMGIAILSVLWYISYIWFKLGTKLSERAAIVWGLCILVVFYLISFPWAFYEMTIRQNLDINMIEIDPQITLNSSDICKYEWCKQTPAVNGYVLFPAIIIAIGTASPLILINLECLYSKLLRTINQGTMQGIFMALGDLLAVISPLIFNYLYEMYGPTIIWTFQLIFNCATLLIVFLTFDRLVVSPSITITQRK
uniref:MFS domain-containing protein n=1 Tax=Rhabditophanes sp. KR3021 TaxID=114890 RepID=A0AC35U0Y6_9BILA